MAAIGPETTYRLVGAGATGVATGLLGTAVPLVGVLVGGMMQVLRPQSQEVQRVTPGHGSDVLDGVVDGSVACLMLAIFR